MEISTEALIFLVLRNSDLDDRSSALHHLNSLRNSFDALFGTET